MMRQNFKDSAPWLFIQQFIKTPALMGAIWPSSSSLAKKIAAHIPVKDFGIVIELGAGTGTVTQGLLARGIAPEQLVLVERSPAFVAHLCRRFPRTTVLQGDAAELNQLLRQQLHPNVHVKAIVSALPLSLFPESTVNAILTQWASILQNGGIVVQITYDLRAQSIYTGWEILTSEIAWINLPPTRVHVLRRISS